MHLRLSRLSLVVVGLFVLDACQESPHPDVDPGGAHKDLGVGEGADTPTGPVEADQPRREDTWGYTSPATPAILDANIVRTIERIEELKRTGTPQDLERLRDSNTIPVSMDGEMELTFHARKFTGEAESRDLLALGARITSVVPYVEVPGMQSFGGITAWLPHDAVEEAAELPWVVVVSAADHPVSDSHPLNPIVAESLAVHNVAPAAAQGINGAGVIVGVISNSATATGINNAQAANALPQSWTMMAPPTPYVKVLSAGTLNPLAPDEGIAMMEIVHDMAPAANLKFQEGSNVGQIAAVQALIADGVNLIVEDLASDVDPVFQRGATAQNYEQAVANGIGVYSSAGNTGNVHAGRVVATPGVQGSPDGAPLPVGAVCANVNGLPRTPSNNLVDLVAGDNTFDFTVAANTTIAITLQWSEPRNRAPTLGQGGFTDLDLYIIDTNTPPNCVAASTLAQGGGVGDTMERIVLTGAASLPAGAYKAFVDVFAAPAGVAAPNMDLKLRGTTPTGGAGQAGSVRAGSLNPDANYFFNVANSVGQLNAQTGFIAASSSAGPIQLGLTTQCMGGATGGCAPAPGVALPAVAAPPYLAAGNVSVSGISGFGNPNVMCPAPTPANLECLFGGTSAAAPSAGGCAALVRQIVGVNAAPATVNARMRGNLQANNTTDCFQALGPPSAVCQPVPKNADPVTCQATITAAEADGGSSDPNGDPITLAVSSTGPFGLGPTAVTLTVSDPNLSSTCTATVTVTDVTPPVVTAPPPITLECGVDTYVELPGSATDACDPSVPVVVGGDVVDDTTVGVYTVTYDATDDAGLPAVQQTRVVTVEDTTAPVITAPDMTIARCLPANVEEVLDVSVSDACATGTLTGSLTSVNGTPLATPVPIDGADPRVVLPIGTSTIVWTAVDAAGVPATPVTQTVTVDETDTPAACCPAGYDVVEGNVFPNYRIRPFYGNYCMFGYESFDTLISGPGADILSGGSGNDMLTSGSAGDILLGRSGWDTLTLPYGAGDVYGGSGNDIIEETLGGRLYGGPGDDLITGLWGDHEIYPGSGRDTVNAGPDDDVVVIYDVCEVEFLEVYDGSWGNDTLITPVPLADLVARGAIVVGFETITVDPSNRQLADCF